MCGIIGAVGRVTVDVERAVKMMLCLDTLRGADSTGIVSIFKDKTHTLAKEVGTPWDLMKTEYEDEKGNKYSPFNRVFQGYAGAFIGHNRAATKGSVTSKNAHPFVKDKYIGVHNGTLVSQWKLDDNKDFDVDSENIYHHMDKNGIKETVKNLNGAYALAFYDYDEHKVRLVRNSQRPMYFCFSEDSKTVFFASEAWMITISCHRNGIKLQEMKETEVDHLYSFPVPDCAPEQFKGYHKMWEDEVVEPYKAPVITYSGYAGQHNYGNYGNNSSVTPFRGRQKTLDSYERARGKTLRFEVIGVTSEQSSNNKFIEASVLDSDKDFDGMDVRIYISLKSDKANDLLSSPHYFEGEMTGVGSYKNNKFLIVGLTSIKELKPHFGGRENKYYQGPDGTWLDMQAYLDAVGDAGGCCRCKRLPLVSDHRDILWISKNELLCKRCADSVTVVPNEEDVK